MSITRGNAIIVRRPGRAFYTAAEFLMTFEPATVYLLTDPRKAFKDDTLEAQRLARELGLPSEGDLFPASVWALVYP